MKTSKNPATNGLKALMLLIALLSGPSCRKSVEIDAPINQLTAKSTFSNEASAKAAIAGIYSRLSQSPLIQTTTPYTGMYADEILNYVQGNLSEFANSALTLTSSPSLNSNFWNSSYQFIYAANSAIEQLSASESLSATLRSGLTGEAKFLRAYLYLNLSSLFGDVPLVLSTGFEPNAKLPRAAKAMVMAQVITDLKDAVQSLPEQNGTEKIRADRSAATALLARACLYDKKYALAAQLAGEVIGSGRYQLIGDLSKVFLKNSSEAILQLYPTQSGQNTPDGLTFLPASATEQPKYFLTQSLLNSFEPGDLRKTNWTASRTFTGQTYVYPNKYKILNTAALSEYLMILRLGEQYLIRAEANIQLGQTAMGIADLNTIRKRARALPDAALHDPLPDLDINMDKDNALLALEKERRIELMSENGHRWFDLQRSGRAEAVIGALKPQTWHATAALWPLPTEQLKLNPFLEQNTGYSK